jgi:ribonucleotide reductase alpha subunit
MMAAAQPFLSGAISKTVNMPHDTTIKDIEDAYYWGWELGLKAVAIYRDGSKQSQPLSTKTEGKKAEDAAAAQIIEKVTEKIVFKPRRERLPDTRASVPLSPSPCNTAFLSKSLSTNSATPGSNQTDIRPTQKSASQRASSTTSSVGSE